MIASPKKRSAQVEPAQKAAALKAANDAKADVSIDGARVSAVVPKEGAALVQNPDRASKANRSQGPPRWIPDPLVAKRYHINPRTLRRWDQDSSLDFPPVIIVNSRRYRELAALEEWERRTAANARSARAKQLKQFADQPAAEAR